MPPPLSPSTRHWYGFGQLAEGVKNEAFSTFLLFYYTAVIGLPGRWAGLAILIALVFDAVTDPLAGVISDRHRSRWGRRHPFMVASALPLAVSFALVFMPPAGLGERGLFLWLLTFAVLCRGSMTLYHVPHLSLGAELSDDYEERTRLVASRYVYSRIGSAATAILALVVFMRPTEAYPDGRFNPAAYPSWAALFAVVMTVTILMSAWGTRSRIPYLPQPHRREGWRAELRKVFEDLRQPFGLRSFRALFFGNVCAFTAWGVATALGLHLATYFWHVTTAELVWWGVGLYVGIFVGLPFWSAATRRLDKKPVFVLGLSVYTAATALPALLKVAGFWPAPGSPAYLPAWILVTGTLAHFGIAAAMVTGGSMMADVTDEDALRHGRRREGIFFGASAFSAKASSGSAARSPASSWTRWASSPSSVPKR